MQPDEEVTKKILYWVEKLGLDQVRRIMTENHACTLFLHCSQHGMNQRGRGSNSGQYGN